jgi:Mg2+ and Co2+ transporter CorA
MRTLDIVLSVVSLLLVVSTLICGFWIHNSKNVADLASSVNFHMMIAVAAGISVLATTILAFVRH